MPRGRLRGVAGYRRFLPKDWRFWIEDMRLCGERLKLRGSEFARVTSPAPQCHAGAGSSRERGRVNKSGGTREASPNQRARAKGRSKKRKRKGK